MTTPIIHAEFNGLRVTPNVYTTLPEIDVFCEKIEETLKKGLPT
jgi:selenocysteine lyase/cysteine desulfurase